MKLFKKGIYFIKEQELSEKRLAKQNLDYWRDHPAKYALWYFNPYAPCPPTWYGQPFTGQFKHHCFYEPAPGTCESVYIRGSDFAYLVLRLQYFLVVGTFISRNKKRELPG